MRKGFPKLTRKRDAAKKAAPYLRTTLERDFFASSAGEQTETDHQRLCSYVPLYVY